MEAKTIELPSMIAISSTSPLFNLADYKPDAINYAGVKHSVTRMALLLGGPYVSINIDALGHLSYASISIDVPGQP